jgi:hypothetical protein
VKRSPLAASRPGFTLVELIVAMGGAGMLITGLFSALYIALKASDTSLTPAAATIQGNATMTGLLSELQFARSFSELSTTAITFSVPGRDGESTSETIRYAWSGTPGDPLTRQYNGGTVAKLVDNVYAFQHDIPSPFPNLLSNADMEAGTNHWEAIPGATMVDESTVVHTGSKSLYCFRDSDNYESGVRQDVTEQIVNGTRYEIGAWLRKWASSQPFGAKVQLHIVSSGGGEQLFSSDPFTIDNIDFKWVYGTVTPTWTGSLLSAYWEASGVSNIQNLYVDDARMRVKPLAGQSVNISLQVGSDPRSWIESGVLLRNSPL